MPTLTETFQNQQDAILAMLREMVEIESPSEDKAAIDRLAKRVAELIRQAGAAVEVFPQSMSGDILLGRWEGTPSRKPILLLCHMDTVWPLGTVESKPPRVEDGRYYGPGAYDMKGGLAIALAALAGLPQGSSPVYLLCTSDEEIGSHASRPLIEKLARESELVMVLEPSLPGGVIKTARKGVGEYVIRAKGRAAHAGADHRLGINAIVEAAHQVLAIQALTNYDLGTTVSAGLIRGGTASNVVPAECEVTVDFRVSVPEESVRLHRALTGLAPRLPGASLEVTGGLNRPPMVRDEQMVRTFEKARQIAARHGFSLQEASTGGASDGNFTAALGVPTLDGLGADGDGGHADHEHVIIASLPARAALLAALISEWQE